jgi:hypothetical protein
MPPLLPVTTHVRNKASLLSQYAGHILCSAPMPASDDTDILAIIQQSFAEKPLDNARCADIPL